MGSNADNGVGRAGVSDSETEAGDGGDGRVRIILASPREPGGSGGIRRNPAMSTQGCLWQDGSTQRNRTGYLRKRPNKAKQWPQTPLPSTSAPPHKATPSSPPKENREL